MNKSCLRPNIKIPIHLYLFLNLIITKFSKFQQEVSAGDFLLHACVYRPLLQSFRSVLSLLMSSYGNAQARTIVWLIHSPIRIHLDVVLCRFRENLAAIWLLSVFVSCSCKNEKKFTRIDPVHRFWAVALFGSVQLCTISSEQVTWDRESTQSSYNQDGKLIFRRRFIHLPLRRIFASKQGGWGMWGGWGGWGWGWGWVAWVCVKDRLRTSFSLVRWLKMDTILAQHWYPLGCADILTDKGFIRPK